MSAWTWSRLEAEVLSKGNKRRYSIADCAAAVKALKMGAGLPPSYVEYMDRFGSGQWKPGLYIHVPTHPRPAATIAVASPNLKSMLEVHLSGGKHAENAALINALIPFAGDGSGHVFCWDQRSARTNGELQIYVVEEEYMKAAPCGRDLIEFLGLYWIERGLDRVMPLADGSWGCEAVFYADGEK